MLIMNGINRFVIVKSVVRVLCNLCVCIVVFYCIDVCFCGVLWLIEMGL